MSVTLFFDDGRIEDFPTATMAEEHDGQVHVLRCSPQLTAEWIAVLPVAGITLAQVYAAGTLQRVVTGDRAAQLIAATPSPPRAMPATSRGRPSIRTGAA